MKRKLIHEPYNAFKGKLREKQITYGDVAQALNLSKTAVSHKINGVSDFYISEVRIISEVLGIEWSIFFAQ